MLGSVASLALTQTTRTFRVPARGERVERLKRRWRTVDQRVHNRSDRTSACAFASATTSAALVTAARRPSDDEAR
jgi:hypothetical protein